MNNDFRVGYASVNINPPLGIGMCGYYVARYARGFLDDLTASALTLSKNGKNIIIISIDNCTVAPDLLKRSKKKIEDTAKIPAECVFFTATHTHTAPFTTYTTAFEVDEKQIDTYVDFLVERIGDLARLALSDMRPARMGYATGYAPDRISYIRRYRMKDGTTQTCPPIDDPNIDSAIGELDRRVHVLRFDREGANSVVILNYGIHTDTIGGDYISSDFCGWMKKTVKAALDGTECMFLAGVQGDVGSTNVHPLPGDMNDTEISFDNEMKSWGMARFVGRALAGTILQVYDKVAYIDVDDIEVIHKCLEVDANVPPKEAMPLALKYLELHESGHDDLIPYEAMELTTVVAEAYRMRRLENGPYTIPLNMIGLRIGSVAFITIPGEPFTDIGRQIKDTEGWDMILPCALTNGSNGYFPMKSAFDEGGYEARTSNYKGGVAESIVAAGKELLGKLKK